VILLRKLFFLVVLLFFNFASAEELSEVTGFIDNLMQECTRLAKQHIAQEQDDLHDNYILNILDEYFDVGVMAKFTAGRYWQGMSMKQRADLVNFYKNFLARNYLSTILEYKNFSYRIINATISSKRGYIVTTDIYGHDKVFAKELKVHYLVALSKDRDRFMVNDIILDGVSVVVSHRSDFAYVLESGGIEALLKQNQKFLIKRN
jgi:phospholipid transport system substrate-binding protein